MLELWRLRTGGTSIGTLAMLALFAGGCESGSSATTPPDTGLSALRARGGLNTADAAPSESEISRLAEQAARDIEALKNNRVAKKPTGTIDPLGAPLDIFAPDESAGTSGNHASETAQTTPSTTRPKTTAKTDPPIPAVPPLPPRDALAAELGAIIARSVRTLKEENAPEQAIGSLIGVLELVHPGFLVSIEDPNSPMFRTLGAADAGTILANRHFVPAVDSGTPIAVSTEHETPAATPEPVAAVPVPPPFSIATAVLCSRVQSFGRYDPLPGQTFAADQPIRALVYVEVEGFGDQAAADGQRFVELSQRLALYTENGSNSVWNTDDQTVREVSRRTRRDFYLVQQVDLPRNLSLGTYFLKVTLEDKISKAQTETRIPIIITATGRTATGQ